jgi:hypothetical protein
MWGALQLEDFVPITERDAGLSRASYVLSRQFLARGCGTIDSFTVSLMKALVCELLKWELLSWTLHRQNF